MIATTRHVILQHKNITITTQQEVILLLQFFECVAADLCQYLSLIESKLLMWDRNQHLGQGLLIVIKKNPGVSKSFVQALEVCVSSQVGNDSQLF